MISPTDKVNHTIKSGKRIKELDYIRGLAMILVIVGHTGIPGNNYLLAFHMPLFFFLSGITLSLKPVQPFLSYVRVRFRRLIIPYLAFELIAFVLSFILCYLHKDPISIPQALADILLVRHSFGPTAHTGFIFRFWFFPCLFFAQLIIYPIIHLQRRRFVTLLFGILMFGVGFLVYRFLPFSFPFTIDIALVASGFILLGFCLSDLSLSLMTKRNIGIDILIVAVSIAGLFLAVKMNPEPVLFNQNSYGHYGWMLLGSVSGIFATIVITKYLFALTGHIPVIANTVLSVGFHALPLFPIHLIVIYFIRHMITLHWFILFIVVLVISLPISYLLTKYLPFIVGASRPQSKQR